MNAYGASQTDELQFRSAVQQLLQKSGITDEIIASVRSRVLLSLSDVRSDSFPQRCTNSNIEQIAIKSLVYDFLEHEGMSCTLSVFSAESGFERHGRSAAFRVANAKTARKVPLSVEKAIKALKLDSLVDDLSVFDREEYSRLYRHSPFSNENEYMPSAAGLVVLLKTLARKEFGKPMKAACYAAMYTDSSIQTDEYFRSPISQTDNANDNKKNSCYDEPENCSFEKRLAEAKSDLQIQIRKEMKEKLRLLAKKERIQAIELVEQKHKEEMTLLHQQISSERTKFNQREEELQNELSRLKLSTEKELQEAKRRIQSLRIENETLESKVALIQRSRIQELTEVHETMGRAHSESMKELDDQKRRLLEESKNLMAKETRVISLEKERGEIESELKSLRTKHDALLKSNEELQKTLSNSRGEISLSTEALKTSEKQVSDLQCRLSELDKSYRTKVSALEKSDVALNASRMEICDLRKLLRQSQSALESLSFHQGETTSRPHKENGNEYPVSYLPNSKLELSSQTLNRERCQRRIDESKNLIIMNGTQSFRPGQKVPECENLLSNQLDHSKDAAFSDTAASRTAASLSTFVNETTEVKPSCPDPPVETDMKVPPSNTAIRGVQDGAEGRKKVERKNDVGVETNPSFERGIPATIKTDLNLSDIDDIASHDADPNYDRNGHDLEEIAPSSNAIRTCKADDGDESTETLVDITESFYEQPKLQNETEDLAWNNGQSQPSEHGYSSCSKPSASTTFEQSENYSDSFQTLAESRISDRILSRTLETSHISVEKIHRNSCSESSSSSGGKKYFSADNDDVSESYSDEW